MKTLLFPSQNSSHLKSQIGKKNSFRTGFISLLLTIYFSSICALVVGQNTDGPISGSVLDMYGEPLIGATIVENGTSNGTVTDVDGNFILSVSDPRALLTISYVGMEDLEISADRIQNQSAIVLQPSALGLDEVVVTALGIEREKRALGYAASELDPKNLNRVRAVNPTNALAGQVPGLLVTGSNNGVASSSRLVIRGESSLRLGGNEPLIILDGVPMNNRIFGVGGGVIDQSNPAIDYGNGFSELNPEDFDEVSVLRGAAASALYGSRAANGVIVINTKKGDINQPGIGVEVSSSLLLSERMDLLDIQDQYGGGWQGEYASNFGTNYGPALNGDIINQELSNGEVVERSFVNRYDLDDFFETGVNQFHNVALSGANEFGHFRASYGRNSNEGIIPNTNLEGNSFRLNAGINITDRWEVNGHANYITRASDNLPVTNYGSQALMYVLLWNYLNVDLDELRDYWIVENREQRRLFTWGENPWFIVNENINGFEKNRFLGSFNTTYRLTDHISFLARIGIDQSDDFRRSRRSIGSQRHPNGMYREQTIEFSEVNADFLLSYDNVFGDFQTTFSIGGNRFDQEIQEGFLEGNGLAIPGLYNPQNINVTPVIRSDVFEKRINSLYAFANIGYKHFLYLDIAARNDWSSTLPTDDNSYFYPSASLAFLPSEIFGLPDYVDFLKLRFNIAQVGNDTDPYNLENTYDFGTLGGTLTNSSALLNANLVPERTTSSEVGLEAYLIDRRLRLDATYYTATTKDQILNLGISTASGFESRLTNSGEIKNSGFELGLQITPISTKDFNWQVNANWTTNNSEVVSLADGLETFIMGIGPDNVTIEARPGEEMGDIYGQVYVRNDAGEIVYENGLPLTSPDRRKVGNYNPDWTLGLSTGIQYRNFNLFALFDIREGGDIYSYTHAIGRESGTLSFTVPWRDGVIGEGVMEDENGNFLPNTIEVNAEDWAYAVPRSNAEANLFDASYVKLRQLSLGYTFDQNWLQNIGCQELSLNLVGYNLFLWTDVPNIDPESQGIVGATLLPGFEITQLPSTRQYGFNVNLKF